MSKDLYFKGRVMIDGKADGEALVSTRAFTFAHGVEPSTGVVTDIRSDMKGESVKDKVIFFPFGKGSTTGTAWFLETVRMGNAPAAVLTQAVDPVIVVGAILANILYGKKIPVMAEFPRSMATMVKNGDLVYVETRNQEIKVRSRR